MCIVSIKCWDTIKQENKMRTHICIHGYICIRLQYTRKVSDICPNSEIFVVIRDVIIGIQYFGAKWTHIICAPQVPNGAASGTDAVFDISASEVKACLLKMHEQPIVWFQGGMRVQNMSTEQTLKFVQLQNGCCALQDRITKHVSCAWGFWSEARDSILEI